MESRTRGFERNLFCRCFNVIDHTVYHKELIQEIKRCLIPEGKFQDDLIDRIVNRKVVTPTELRKWYPDTTALSPISGRKIEEDFTRNITKSVNKWVNKAFKLLGTIPEDKWARFPLYDNLYRHNFTQSVMLSERLKGGALTSFEMNNLMKDAHVLSVREVNKILYTVVRKSNLGCKRLATSSSVSSTFE
jgi:hypothetical protein